MVLLVRGCWQTYETSLYTYLVLLYCDATTYPGITYLLVHLDEYLLHSHNVNDSLHRRSSYSVPGWVALQWLYGEQLFRKGK